VHRRALFIIGAGRSGTSALTRGIQCLGVDLGNRFKHATRKNPTGFFEDAELLALSKKVRRALGLRADSVRLLDKAEWDNPKIGILRNEAIAIIQRRFAQAPVWGFKYGRTLRLLPFWEPVLQQLAMEPAFVLALRNPLSVARSRAKLDARRGVQEHSDLEWLVSIVPYFSRLRGRPLVVVDYDLLMEAPAQQLRRVARGLELMLDAAADGAIETFAGDFLQSGMRHSRFDLRDLDENPRLNPLCRDAYLLLYRLASDELRADQEEFWQAWAAIEQTLEAQAPLLRQIDHIGRAYRYALWNPLSPLWGRTKITN
jgi:hypothetical protein